MLFLALYIFARLFRRARKTLVKQPPVALEKSFEFPAFRHRIASSRMYVHSRNYTNPLGLSNFLGPFRYFFFPESRVWHLYHCHGDIIKWKHFPCYKPFVSRIHRWPVNSPHKGQWRGALLFSLICAWIYGWVNNHEAGDLRQHRAHYSVIVMVEIGVWVVACCIFIWM